MSRNRKSSIAKSNTMKMKGQKFSVSNSNDMVSHRAQELKKYFVYAKYSK